jgi:hypothetical protein
MIEAWREEKISGVLRLITPVSCAFILSFLIYGFYPLRASELTYSWWNVSVFPASLPVALVLFVSAIQSRDENKAIVASPLISPYLNPGSYMLPFIGLARVSSWQLAAAVAGMWLVVLIYL